MLKKTGAAASVCLNPKFVASCHKYRRYRCKEICFLIDNEKYEKYMKKMGER
jgi:hypothetical protein